MTNSGEKECRTSHQSSDRTAKHYVYRWYPTNNNNTLLVIKPFGNQERVIAFGSHSTGA